MIVIKNVDILGSPKENSIEFSYGFCMVDPCTLFYRISSVFAVNLLIVGGDLDVCVAGEI